MTMETNHAQQASETGPDDARGRPRPRVRPESGDTPQGGEGVRRSRQAPRQAEEVKVLRVMNPRALAVPPLSDLLDQALEGVQISGEGARDEIIRRVGSPGFGVFVGRQGGAFKALAIATWSSSALAPVCSVYQFYNKGRKALREALVAALVAFAREGGYDRVLTIDTNRKGRAFSKVFSTGGQVTEVGQAYLIDIEKGAY